MIDKIFHSFLGSHRRFRHMTFDELSELYTSIMLRSLAMNMAGVFIPIYLFQKGFEIWQVLLFYGLMFGVQFLTVFPAARLIAKIGPKHTLLISYVLQAITMLGLIHIAILPSYYLLVLPFGVANFLFFFAFYINFSKVKHKKSGGREVSWLYAMERFGAVAGPFVGGAVAFIFAPQYTFAVSIILLLSAAIPLFLTEESVKRGQKLDFVSLKLASVKRDIISNTSFVLENTIVIVVWPLFIGIVVFNNNPYLQVGSILSISIIVSILVARMIGRTVDNKKGRVLLRYNAVANGLLHLFRPFTSGFPMALGINIVNDMVTPGYRMPFLKGLFDAADDHPGFRIVYFSVLEMFGALTRAVFFGLAALGAYYIGSGRLFFGVLFGVAGIASLLIMVEKFPALKPARRFGKL